MNNDDDIKVTKSNIKYKEKKDIVINQKPKKNEKLFEKPDKKDIRNLIWIIMLFIILFSVLIFLPYMSNYR